MKMSQFIKYKYVITVLFFALLSVMDLLNFGIPPTHDGEYHIMRFQQFSKVFEEGVLYPRWAPDFNNGFGIPLFNYVYPLPNYFSAIFHFFGVGFIDAFKLNMAIASIIGAIFMYLWSRKFWGDLGGVVSSVFYTFSPYHFLDIYVRGSVGEVWSLAFIPCLLWAYTTYFENYEKKYLVLSTVFLFMLILAHNILALVFFTFFIIYALFLQSISRSGRREERPWRRIYSLGLIVFTGLGLSSPFWLPAIIETKYVVGLQVFDPARHFPIFYKLIYSSWGYGFSGGNAPDQMSFQIGIANLIAVVGSIFVLFRTKNKRVHIFFFSMFLIIVFLITPFSIFLWKSIPLMGFIQFPWRLLSLVILLVSFLAGSIVAQKGHIKKEKTRIIIAIFLILLSIGFSIKYAKAPFYHQRLDKHYLSRTNFTDGTNSPGNAFNTKWMLSVPDKESIKIIPNNSVDVNIHSIKSQEYKFRVYSKHKTRIIINTSYFPGWTAVVNNKQTKVGEHKGRLSLEINSGESDIKVYLDSTPIQKTSYVIFLLSVLILTIFREKTPVIIKT